MKVLGARVIAESVTKSYGGGRGAAGVDALLGVSLALDPGSFTALLGDGRTRRVSLNGFPAQAFAASRLRREP
ncbi:MAG: hypothetical protein ACHQJD_08970 [Thermoanaerobaculia bacterium]